jgi:hypothetical protein
MTSEPAYLRDFKKFAKSRPDRDMQDAMEKEFYGESDRACGILFPSWVELLIERAIQDQLRHDAPTVFDYEGPLGNFSAKIMMAYAMGLFGMKTNHDLRLIRTIRNEFAHCQLPLRFDIPEVKGVCDHLMLPDIEEVRVMPPYLYRLPDDRTESWYDQEHPKTRFVICCYTIIYQLFKSGRQFSSGPVERAKLP